MRHNINSTDVPTFWLIIIIAMRNLLIILIVSFSFALVADDKPLIPTGAVVEKVAGGYQFTEGPTADQDGDVYFSDIPNNRILRFDPATDKVRVLIQPSGRANGLMFDRRNRLVACQGAAEGGKRRLIRYDHDGGETVLADRYENKKLNSPNDLVIDRRGGIYFTDPRYGNRDDMEMTVEAVYYSDRDGTLIRVIDDLERPNGIILSPGGDTLYVADQAGRTIYAYDVNTDGTVANKRPFVTPAPGGADGMTVDDRGRLYAATSAGIEIWNRRGRPVATLKVPEQPSNCAFGGHDRQTLYITARTSLYRIKLNATGL